MARNRPAGSMPLAAACRRRCCPARLPMPAFASALLLPGAGNPMPWPPGARPFRWRAGDFTRLYVLAASAEGDQKAIFRIGSNPVELTIQDWGGYIGQWDNRLWNRVEVPVPPPSTPALPLCSKG